MITHFAQAHRDMIVPKQDGTHGSWKVIAVTELSPLSHLLCMVFLIGMLSFGVISVLREHSKYKAYCHGKGDLFSSPRRYKRRVLCSLLLMATGVLLYSGFTHFSLIRTPSRFMLFVASALLCCLGTLLLLLLDILETGRTLSRHYDRTIQQNTDLLKRLSNNEPGQESNSK